MPKITVPFNQGWIKSKDNVVFSKELTKIINFYVFGTPCEFTSSSGQTIRDRKWDKNTWKNPDLRTYLLSRAELLKGVTYAKATKLDEMTALATTVGLSGNFQNNRGRNRIVFYDDKKTVNILAIFYYIRCSFAHGRFQIYNNNTGENIYVLEAISKSRGKSDYIVKARMILKESTLILWANTIMGGENAFAEERKSMEKQVQNYILEAIRNAPSLTKPKIVESVAYDDTIVYKQFKVLVSNGRISYDNRKKIWQCKKGQEK